MRWVVDKEKGGKRSFFFVEARMKKKLHDASSYIIFVLLANCELLLHVLISTTYIAGNVT